MEIQNKRFRLPKVKQAQTNRMHQINDRGNTFITFYFMQENLRFIIFLKPDYPHGPSGWFA